MGMKPYKLLYYSSALGAFQEWFASVAGPNSGRFVVDLAHHIMWLIRNHIHLFIYPSVCPPTYDLFCRLHSYSALSAAVCHFSLHEIQ